MGYRFESEEEADPEEPPASLGNLNPKQFEKRQELLSEFTPLTPEMQVNAARNRETRRANKAAPARINEHYHVGIVDQQSKDNYELGDGNTPYNFEHIIPVDIDAAQRLYPRASKEMLVKIAHATAQRTAKAVLEKHFQSIPKKNVTTAERSPEGFITHNTRFGVGARADLEAFITHRYQLEGDPKHEEEPGSFYADYGSQGYALSGSTATPVSPVVGRYVQSTRKDGSKTMRVSEATRQPGQINVGANPYR